MSGGAFMKKKLFKDSSLKERLLKMLNKEGFYVAIFLCITLVATMVIYFTNNNFEKDLAKDKGNVSVVEPDTNIETEDVSKVIEDPEENVSNKPDESKTDTNKTKPSTEKSATPNTSDPLKNIQNPVSSNDVVMAFSNGGAPVYSKTLDQYSSDHSGVDIKAEVGKDVKAAMDGKVIKIYNDGKLGQTIVIQHSNNIETRYSNLAEKVAVTKNQTVKSGQVIGNVGKTASFEVDDDPHVHFEIWKDGKCVDPTQYLK